VRVLTTYDEQGPYTARADALPPLPPAAAAAPVATEPVTWRVWEGVLQDGDGESPGYRDDYLVPMRAGELRVISVESTRTDIYEAPRNVITSFDVRVIAPGEEEDPLLGDMASGAASIAFIPPVTGDYRVRVFTIGDPDRSGRYRLRISE